MERSLPFDIEVLLEPIPGDSPAGEDLFYAQVFDDIKAARREDDETLSEGIWKRQAKKADWPKVRDLCAEALTGRSKDLRLACWLTEALGHLHEFRGIESGLLITARLLDMFWEGLHPVMTDGDLEERASCLEQLATIVRMRLLQLPLTMSDKYRFGWLAWDEAQRLENLGRKDPEAAKAALNEGKINQEIWAQAAADTPVHFITQRLEDIRFCQVAFEALISAANERFGRQAPNLTLLGQALEQCLDLVTQTAKVRGISITTEIAVAPTTASIVLEETVDQAGTATTSIVPAPLAGRVGNREEALQTLAEIATFFHRTEPHSPVAYLVERALKWARMPLEDWLAEVVKDQGVLEAIKEILGCRPTPTEPHD